MSKRLLDMLVAGFGLILFMPIGVVIAAAIKCTSKGPVFFRQQRVGYRGQTFRIWKFRSMVASADQQGLCITKRGDARITPLGVQLRRFKIDELPQLINVFFGEMSLVGPRPEVPKYVAYYTEEQMTVLSVRPGITDPASLEFIDEEKVLAAATDPEHFYRTVVMQRKLALNLDYIRRASIWSDLMVVTRTVWHIGSAVLGRFVPRNRCAMS